ncbi:putative transcriptional regulator, Nlp [Ammonifex degensii KC4]|uniref:Transcriptional regulator, Nlp n=1 Tax=Ammonifex degensii (strain DSM 10501 / KC4) TaxID=429009 RepID=C9R7L1_AMMDK|nr:helix-turn-helix transcriptional regulator [Ammonifex degensii]ACX52290.1 putative transcriptional regulator, Nlp [Ammonifex degensii KC4]
MLRFVAERKKRGWSQFELARRTGIHPSNLSKLERGVWPVYQGWRIKIAEALGWPLDRLDELFEEVRE